MLSGQGALDWSDVLDKQGVHGRPSV
jgi:hypothetical protein